MARTRDSSQAHKDSDVQHAGTPANSNIPPTSTQKGATKAAPKSKRSREVNNNAVTELEQPAPAKKPKTTISKPKRQREADTTGTEPELEQTVPMKKAKTTPRNLMDNAQVSVAKSQAPARRHSNRAQTKVPSASTTEKRKRRTKAEIAADKAKADAEKRRKDELTEENRRTMIQMDVEEDINRAEAVAKTIRTFADLERNTESSGEEFAGFNDIGSQDSHSDSDREPDGHGGEDSDPVKLKVSFPSLSCFSEKLLTSANRRQTKHSRSESRLSRPKSMVVRRMGWVGRSTFILLNGGYY